MTILLVEDEPLAARRLEALLREVAPEARVVGQTESVRETRRWLEAHPVPDLLLLDIQLADGLSFELFQQTPLEVPVIFTTAYDEYALRAFKVNSVDYLLKPIEREELAGALDKFRRQQGTSAAQVGRLLEAYGLRPAPAYRSRFLLRLGGRLEVVPLEEVLYLFAEDKLVFLVTTDGRKLPLDEPLDELERQLDPARFTRFNRKFLGTVGALDRIEPHFNGKLRLWLRHRPADEEIYVSRERAEGFRAWLDR
jgi:DNA-binding LytR/AlgR family response regulator